MAQTDTQTDIQTDMATLGQTRPSGAELVKNLTPRPQCDVFRAAFRNLVMFWYRVRFSLELMLLVHHLLLSSRGGQKQTTTVASLDSEHKKYQ